MGRVQSPTLALIVDREKEIEAFKPQTYWKISARLDKDLQVKHEKGGSGTASWRGRYSEGLGDVATVVSIREKTRTDRPPAPFDTTAFISAASAQTSAANAMRIAEVAIHQRVHQLPQNREHRLPEDPGPPGSGIDLQEGALPGGCGAGPVGADGPDPREEVLDGPPPHIPDGSGHQAVMKPDQWKTWLVVRRFLATLSGPSAGSS